ncbi:D-(-)-3-hydroxybutyrate oligomer hydrolase, partial [Dyella sp. ASV21]|uniref:D-(-)-3-hydroxybutyrate oligomer hydrolase n=1 Tax=Dyella sp. ASV21 TaxID=2795114 RepID=UPI001E632E71
MSSAASDVYKRQGLGLSGLAGAPAPFAHSLQPTPQELRRRAIQTSWKGIADLGP